MEVDTTFDSDLQAAMERCGIDYTLKKEQKQCLQLLYEEGPCGPIDLIVQLPTGFGKSSIYTLLPALLERKLRLTGCVIVVRYEAVFAIYCKVLLMFHTIKCLK